MRAGGMSESSKWKKQKRSPRPPRHVTKVSPGTEQPTANTSNTIGKLKSVFRDQAASILELFFLISLYFIFHSILFCISGFFYVFSDYSNKTYDSFSGPGESEEDGIRTNGGKHRPVANLTAFLCFQCALQWQFVQKGMGSWRDGCGYGQLCAAEELQGVTGRDWEREHRQEES